MINSIKFYKMTHTELVTFSEKWIIKKTRCSFAFSEIKCINAEIADVIGFASGDYSILIECKISRSDFLQDRKKPFRNSNSKAGVGKYRFYSCPEGLIKSSELPENWGLIYFSEKGMGEIIWNPYCACLTGNIWFGGFEMNKEAERNVLYSALRRTVNRL